MATCKDCMNYSGCTSEWHKLSKVEIEHLCCNFKNKADFVEVVRCKDCVYGAKSDVNGYLYCSSMTNPNYVSMEHFCSYGERKDSVEE